uniref:Kunitz-type carboxypeptidase inhibitor Kci-6 n=1 Tax=Androctonus bicolor TaxID=748906 RepID=A0A0K0LBS7_9SCOR|nr:Kunitz-type carboxypeptidase inhibitor Kci-6 [Androctonus bicolor]
MKSAAIVAITLCCLFELFANAQKICSLPPETGKGKAMFTRYYRNNNSKTCETFTYGGIGGNKNNFLNKESCCKACNARNC